MKYEYSQYWQVIVYPENAADGVLDFDEIFSKCPYIGFAVSPLHSSDQEEGSPKPHYHVMIDFHESVGKRKEMDLRKIFGNLVMPVATHDMCCSNPYQAFLYLTHSDKKSLKMGKEKFSPGTAPTLYQGFEIPADPDGIHNEITMHIINQRIMYYTEVTRWCMAQGDDYMECVRKFRGEFRDLCVSNHTYFKDRHYADDGTCKTPTKEGQ